MQGAGLTWVMAAPRPARLWAFTPTAVSTPLTASQQIRPEHLAHVADYGSVWLARVANGTITSLAGNGRRANTGDNGPATAAEVNLLNSCGSSAFDSAGNVWFSDTANNRIRKVSAGVITTVAGNGTKGFSGDNGPAISAEFNQPCGIAIDSTGILYVADGGNSRVRKIAGGVISTSRFAELASVVSVAITACGQRAAYWPCLGCGGRRRERFHCRWGSGPKSLERRDHHVRGQQIVGYGGDGYNAVFALLSSPSVPWILKVLSILPTI